MMNRTPQPVRVILVDDEPIQRSVTAHMVESQGGTVVGEAADGDEGVVLYDDLRPDLVFMDVQMPRMDGREAVRMIRTLVPEARVVIMTSLDRQEALSFSYRGGRPGYIFKGARFSRINREVRRHLLTSQSHGRLPA